MARREWFTPEICEGLTKADCGVINRAARHLADEGWIPTHSTLSAIRMTYQPGMSAKDVADKVEEKIS